MRPAGCRPEPAPVFSCRSIREKDMAEWFVAKTSELKEGDRRIVSAGKREIGVFHKEIGRAHV